MPISKFRVEVVCERVKELTSETLLSRLNGVFFYWLAACNSRIYEILTEKNPSSHPSINAHACQGKRERELKIKVSKTRVDMNEISLTREGEDDPTK